MEEETAINLYKKLLKRLENESEEKLRDLRASETAIVKECKDSLVSAVGGRFLLEGPKRERLESVCITKSIEQTKDISKFREAVIQRSSKLLDTYQKCKDDLSKKNVDPYFESKYEEAFSQCVSDVDKNFLMILWKKRIKDLLIKEIIDLKIDHAKEIGKKFENTISWDRIKLEGSAANKDIYFSLIASKVISDLEKDKDFYKSLSFKVCATESKLVKDGNGKLVPKCEEELLNFMDNNNFINYAALNISKKLHKVLPNCEGNNFNACMVAESTFQMEKLLRNVAKEVMGVNPPKERSVPSLATPPLEMLELKKEELPPGYFDTKKKVSDELRKFIDMLGYVPTVDEVNFYYPKLYQVIIGLVGKDNVKSFIESI